MIPQLDTIRQGDVLDVLRSWPDGFIQCVVTSPPYWGLRDYGVVGQIGLEPTPEAYVAKMVEVFREARRVLRDDGTLWLNLGDSYASGGMGGHQSAQDGPMPENFHGHRPRNGDRIKRTTPPPGLKSKDLIGIPWRVALALQADGWYLRSDIIWAKRNCMPESVTDRPTRAHEYIFLMTKNPTYFYDAEAIKEKGAIEKGTLAAKGGGEKSMLNKHTGINYRPPEYWEYTGQRNKRSWWPIATQPFPEAHFATFPPEIPETCIKAGTSERGCCLHCGAPAERVIERYDTGRRQKMADGWDTGEGGHGTIHRTGREKGEAGVPVMANRTTGWRLPCDCAEALKNPPTYDHCIVLDPFMGAGTTALVAAQLNRHFLGIELNPEYIKIAERRIAAEVSQAKMF